jgi:uncharacterized protein (TIGR00369 family)
MDHSAEFTERQRGFLPDYLGLQWQKVGRGEVRGSFAVKQHHIAPNGFLHAASVIALVDSACGYGCLMSLPEGAASFTTVEIKSNFLGTAREGVVTCSAQLVHGGRTTQVWDAEAIHQDTGNTIALFRCTQLLLYPSAAT